MSQFTSNDLRGVGVALVTPFTKEGEIDYIALEQLVNHCINGGCSYLVALGTTGETATLTLDEQPLVLKAVLQSCRNRVPVLAGLGGNCTQEVIDRIPRLDLEGVAGFLSSSPHYNKPTQEGIYRHYLAIAQASPKPVVLYNVPSRTGQSITSSTVLRLAEASKNIIGIKEASGDLSLAMQIIAQAPDNFAVISGDDFLTLPLIALGLLALYPLLPMPFPNPLRNLCEQPLTMI